MKKALMIVLTLVMGLSVFSMSGCESYDYVIGILQYAPHPALDKSNEGFKEELQAWADEKGVKIKFDDNNANGDDSNNRTIAQTLAAKRQMDMIFAIATPSATLAVANAADKKIPVVYTAVTDPVTAELTGRTHVTGTSDMADDLIARQMDLLLAARSGDGKIAMLYCSSETNSEVQVKAAADYLKTKDVAADDIKNYTVVDTNGLNVVLNQIVQDGVSVVYSPTDNLIANNISSVGTKFKPVKIPFICGEGGMVDEGGLMAVGVDYKALGVQTAKIAIRVLEGTPAGDIAWEKAAANFAFTINDGYKTAMAYTQEQVDAFKEYADRV
ncbi:MAG: ABC transporter substrate-binding protein [Clostridiales bacterium]|jgi:putative ABC transport system substrate-binding protein|nr:ABC transporter substrate-binding protein [Clostridiales bacterium]